MGRQRHLLLCLSCVVAFGGLTIIANHFYWSASGPQYPRGEYILFGRSLPDPFGRWLWLAMKPMLLGTMVAVGWSFYCCVRVWRAGPQAGLCRVCGYDLRATPHRCPECGTVVPEDTESPSQGKRV